MQFSEKMLNKYGVENNYVLFFDGLLKTCTRRGHFRHEVRVICGYNLKKIAT